jgi:hypothetical protein
MNRYKISVVEYSPDKIIVSKKSILIPAKSMAEALKKAQIVAKKSPVKK